MNKEIRESDLGDNYNRPREGPYYEYSDDGMIQYSIHCTNDIADVLIVMTGGGKDELGEPIHHIYTNYFKSGIRTRFESSWVKSITSFGCKDINHTDCEFASIEKNDE